MSLISGRLATDKFAKSPTEFIPLTFNCSELTLSTPIKVSGLNLKISSSSPIRTFLLKKSFNITLLLL